MLKKLLKSDFANAFYSIAFLMFAFVIIIFSLNSCSEKINTQQEESVENIFESSNETKNNNTEIDSGVMLDMPDNTKLFVEPDKTEPEPIEELEISVPDKSETICIEPNDPVPIYSEPPISQYVLDAVVPNFLNDEQVNLYRRALSIFRLFRGDPDGIDRFFPLPEGIEKNIPQFNMIETYSDTRSYMLRYFPVIGRYREWDDFLSMCLSIFTSDYFSQLNRCFINVNGYTYYADVAAGGRLGYASDEDTFELKNKTNMMISFEITGYYYESGIAALTKSGTKYPETYPITMVLTENGWRFSEFNFAW